MKVLSLCDGASCAHIALDMVGIPVDTYYASEIKDIGIKVTMTNYPDTVQIGDVHKVHYADGMLTTENGTFDVGHIDFVIFGSPCQSFSRCMKTDKRIGLDDPQRSGLFYECYRVLQEVHPDYFLMENVASMRDEDRNYITSLMGVQPLRINGKLVSAALRDRYYWTNIPGVTEPVDQHITLQSILTSGYADRDKARTLLVSDCRPLVNKDKMLHRYKKFTTIVWEIPNDKNSIRYLNQIELERCQNMPYSYTSCLTRNEAANVIGDGFCCGVIAHILSFLPNTTK